MTSMNWNEKNIDIKELIRQYNNGIDIEDLAFYWGCCEATIINRLKKAGVYCKVKKLDPKIPGERYWIMNDNDEIEEVRTCYDVPRFLPKWDKNPDDEEEE